MFAHALNHRRTRTIRSAAHIGTHRGNRMLTGGGVEPHTAVTGPIRSWNASLHTIT